MTSIGKHAGRAPGWARRVAVDVAVAVVALVLAGLTILDEVGPHDEGLVLAAAGRVAAGQLPYRDFWWNYGPGEPVLLAALVKLFGPSLLAWRILRIAVGAGVAVLCGRLARRHGAGEGWSLAAGLAAGSAVAWPLTPGPTVLALAPALGALLAVRTPDDRPEFERAGTGRAAAPAWTPAVLAAVLAGLAAWLRPELGAAAGLGALVLLPGARVRVVLVAAVTTAVLYGPFVLAAPGAFWDDVVGFARIQGLQRLPFPLDPPGDPNKAFEVLFPAGLVAATVGWVLLGRVRPPALAPFVLVGLAYLLARTDEFHLVPLALVLAPALAVAAARAAGAARVVLALALGLLALGGVERQLGRLLHPPALAAVPGGAGDGVRTTARDAAALRVLLPRVRALGRPVLVVPPRLDRVQVGDPLLNVVLGLPNPTRYDVIQPGLVTRDAVQREIVRDLLRSGATVVRWSAPQARAVEPNGAGRERGSGRFDRFLAARYRPLLRTGDYLVLVPRGKMAP